MEAALKVVEYISQHGLGKLIEEYGIIVSRDAEAAPHLICLNYDQIASPKSHPIVQECRGLILNADTLDVVSRSFDRFYNYGEVPEQTKQVDFSRAVAFEKLDGSLLNWYYDEVRQQWIVASRGTTTARNAITKSRVSFHHLICLILGVDVSDMNPLVDEETTYTNAAGEVLIGYVNWLDTERYDEYVRRINAAMTGLVAGNTYITELVSPLINIVTQYSESALYWLATRNAATGAFVDFTHDKFRLPTVYPTASLAQLQELINSFSKDKILREGVVVHDPVSGVRTKLKNTVYLKAHRNIGRDIDAKSIIELVAANEEAEYLAYFPTDAPAFQRYVDYRAEVIAQLDALLQRAHTCAANGDSINVIAKWLKDEPLSSFVFSAFKRNIHSGAQAFATAGEGARLSTLKKIQPDVASDE